MSKYNTCVYWQWFKIKKQKLLTSSFRLAYTFPFASLKKIYQFSIQHHTILSFNYTLISIIQIIMANGVNTEWYDLQVKFNNYLPKQKQKTLYEVQKEAQLKFQEENKLQNQLDKKTVENIKEMEDDLDFDDQFMREYMAKRRAEIVQKAIKHKYGSLIEISRDEYVRQVTNANPDDFVVIHLYQDSVDFCVLINRYLQQLAAEQGHIKFIKMISTKCIEKFPDEKCPCFIIYKGGKPIGNYVNVDQQINKDVKNLPNFLRTICGIEIQ